jgi:hypothetical protein
MTGFSVHCKQFVHKISYRLQRILAMFHLTTSNNFTAHPHLIHALTSVMWQPCLGSQFINFHNACTFKGFDMNFCFYQGSIK